MKTKKTICYVAAKSGGHIIPCLTLIENAKNESSCILFFSGNSTLDKTIITHNAQITWHIVLPLMTRNGIFFIIIWQACVSFIKSFFYLYKHKPTTIITTGGIIALAPCIAGFILRIPITLYSLDAVPGKAIKALIPLATSIITCFSTTQRYFPAHKCLLKPYPLKYNAHTLIDLDTANSKKNLGLAVEKKTILVLGGSQGSLFLNQCMVEWVNSSFYTVHAPQIIHQTGPNNRNIVDNYSQKGITTYTFNYKPDLASLYASANLIICRAGAGTLFEILFFNKPCLVIPLETNTTSHQIDNANAMSAEYPHLFYTLQQSIIEQDHTMLFIKINELLHLHPNTD